MSKMPWRAYEAATRRDAAADGLTCTSTSADPSSVSKLSSVVPRARLGCAGARAWTSRVFSMKDATDSCGGAPLVGEAAEEKRALRPAPHPATATATKRHARVRIE